MISSPTKAMNMKKHLFFRWLARTRQLLTSVPVESLQQPKDKSLRYTTWKIPNKNYFPHHKKRNDPYKKNLLYFVIFEMIFSSNNSLCRSVPFRLSAAPLFFSDNFNGAASKAVFAWDFFVVSTRTIGQCFCLQFELIWIRRMHNATRTTCDYEQCRTVHEKSSHSPCENCLRDCGNNFHTLDKTRSSLILWWLMTKKHWV